MNESLPSHRLGKSPITSQKLLWENIDKLTTP